MLQELTSEEVPQNLARADAKLLSAGNGLSVWKSSQPVKLLEDFSVKAMKCSGGALYLGTRQGQLAVIPSYQF